MPTITHTEITIKTRDFKTSSFIFVIIGIFLIIDLIGYRLLYVNITTSHEKDAKIIFYEIQTQTSDLLSKLLFQHHIQQDTLIKKHQDVKKYFDTHSYDTDLEQIRKQLNKSNTNNPYNIYITDDNLVIKNTTFKADIGFDLSYEKKVFDEHHKNKIIGCSIPLFEKYSKNFLSFTDSYISNDNKENKHKLLQVSYTYFKTKKDLIKIQKLIKNRPVIEDAQAYIIVGDNFVNEINLKEYPSHKPSLIQMQDWVKESHKIKKRLGNDNLKIESFQKNGVMYKALYLSSVNAINDDAKIIYYILFNESEFHASLKNLNYLMLMITVLGIAAILIITKIRSKEIRLSEQDRFVQSAMHEIKTPLSIITLNNELRELEFGEDEYSEEINTALKTLRSSYDDMSFILTKERLHYPVELLSLDVVLRSRIDYFQSIARANSKTIIFENKGGCTVEISHTELLRLIDNNLSNAIKYSAPKSRITVTLDQAMISFHNSGKPIQNSTKIFDKYFRENSVLGGYGLGLSIVRDIAKKYSIKIRLDSDEKTGTIFTYFLKCHTDDIPSV